ncbi:hypothetical protein J4227_00900 [Candidatus Woesearchaeota archaeon]|nr:hypothetical protein [Candidatus Woesearchaeota archaeon]
MAFGFLRPTIVNVTLTLLVLLLPIMHENVQLPDGGTVQDTYAPMQLIVAYIYLGDLYPLMLMFGYALAVYIAISLIILAVTRVNKFFLLMKIQKF